MTSNHQTADILRGWITTFYIRRGAKSHGPYYARTWRVKGKLKRQYIKPEDLERVRAACQRFRERRKKQIEVSKGYNLIAGNLNFLFRMFKRSQKRNRPRQHEAAHLAGIQTEGLQAPNRPNLRRPYKIRIPKWPNHRTKGFMYPPSDKYSPNPEPEPQQPPTSNPAADLVASFLARQPKSAKDPAPTNIKQANLPKPKKKIVTLWKRIPPPWAPADDPWRDFYYHINRSRSKTEPNTIIEHRFQCNYHQSSTPPPGWTPDCDALKRPWEEGLDDE